MNYHRIAFSDTKADMTAAYLLWRAINSNEHDPVGSRERGQRLQEFSILLRDVISVQEETIHLGDGKAMVKLSYGWTPGTRELVAPQPVWTEGVKSWERLLPHLTSPDRDGMLRLADLIDANEKLTQEQRDERAAAHRLAPPPAPPAEEAPRAAD